MDELVFEFPKKIDKTFGDLPKNKAARFEGSPIFFVVARLKDDRSVTHT